MLVHDGNGALHGFRPFAPDFLQVVPRGGTEQDRRDQEGGGQQELVQADEGRHGAGIRPMPLERSLVSASRRYARARASRQLRAHHENGTSRCAVSGMHDIRAYRETLLNKDMASLWPPLKLR